MAVSRIIANSDPSTLMVKNVPDHVTEDAFRDMLMNDPNNGVWSCNPNRRGKGPTAEVIKGQYFVNFVDSYFAEVALKEWDSREFFPGVQLRVELKMLKPGQKATSSTDTVHKAWWDRQRLWNGAQKVSDPDFVFVPAPVEQPTNSYTASSQQGEMRERPNTDSFSRAVCPPNVKAYKSSQLDKTAFPLLGSAALALLPLASQIRSQDTDGWASKPGSPLSADSGYHSPSLSASSAASSPPTIGPALDWEWYEAVRYDRESNRDEWAATVMAYLPTLDFV